MSAGQLLNTFEDIKAYLDSLVKGEYLLKSETNFSAPQGRNQLLTQAERSKLLDLPVITQAQVDQFVEAYDRGDWNAAIVTDHETNDDTKIASASAVYNLRGMVDSINALIASDDTNLDELQEIVDFIKNNKTDLESLGITNIAGLQAALDTKLDTAVANADFARLDGSNMPFTGSFSVNSPTSDIARFESTSTLVGRMVLASAGNTWIMPEAPTGKKAGFIFKKGSSFQWSVLGDWSDNKLKINYPDHTGANYFTIQPDGKIGIGSELPVGQLHVHSGSSGVAAFGNDSVDLIVESSDNTGITIASPSTKQSRLIFADDIDAVAAGVTWDATTNNFRIGTFHSGGTLSIQSDDRLPAIDIDASQNVTVSGELEAPLMKFSDWGGWIGVHADLGYLKLDTLESEMRLFGSYTINMNSNGYLGRNFRIQNNDVDLFRIDADAFAHKIEGSLDVGRPASGTALLTLTNDVGSGRLRLNGADQFELFNELNDDLLFGTDNSERARITASGHFLVNSTVDSGEQFKVIGTSKLQGSTEITGPLTLSGASSSILMNSYNTDSLSSQFQLAHSGSNVILSNLLGRTYIDAQDGVRLSYNGQDRIRTHLLGTEVLGNANVLNVMSSTSGGYITFTGSEGVNGYLGSTPNLGLGGSSDSLTMYSIGTAASIATSGVNRLLVEDAASTFTTGLNVNGTLTVEDEFAAYIVLKDGNGTTFQLNSGGAGGGIFSLRNSDTDTDLLRVNQTGEVEILSGGSASKPALGFGDGDTGFYLVSDDAIGISTDGANRFFINANGISSNSTPGAFISRLGASATLPVFSFVSDEDTGIGRSGDDGLSLIAGGNEIMRLNGSNATDLKVDVWANLRVGPTASEYLITSATHNFFDSNNGAFYIRNQAAGQPIRIEVDGSTRILDINANGIDATGTLTVSGPIQAGTAYGWVAGEMPDENRITQSGGLFSFYNSGNSLARVKGGDAINDDEFVTKGQIAGIADTGFLKTSASDTYSAADWRITANTVDGADTAQMAIAGGGALGQARGSYLVVYGNDHTVHAGHMDLRAGDAGKVRVYGSSQFDSDVLIDSGATPTSVVFEDDHVPNRYQFTHAGNDLDSYFNVTSGSSRESHIRSISGTIVTDLNSGFGRAGISFSGADFNLRSGGDNIFTVSQNAPANSLVVNANGGINTPVNDQGPEYQFGNLVIGTATDNSWSFIRHRSQPDNFANYGITLSAQGDTKINAVNGRNLYLDIGNASKLVLTSTLFSSSVPVSIGDSSATPSVQAGLKVHANQGATEWSYLLAKGSSWAGIGIEGLSDEILSYGAGDGIEQVQLGTSANPTAYSFNDATGHSFDGQLAINGHQVWHEGNLTDLSQLANGPGYLTSTSLTNYARLDGSNMPFTGDISTTENITADENITSTWYKGSWIKLLREDVPFIKFGNLSDSGWNLGLFLNEGVIGTMKLRSQSGAVFQQWHIDGVDIGLSNVPVNARGEFTALKGFKVANNATNYWTFESKDVNSANYLEITRAGVPKAVWTSSQLELQGNLSVGGYIYRNGSTAESIQLGTGAITLKAGGYNNIVVSDDSVNINAEGVNKLSIQSGQVVVSDSLTTQGNAIVSGYLSIGSGSSDTNLRFWDNIDSDYKEIKWDNSQNAFRLQDGAGVFHSIIHSGNIDSYTSNDFVPASTGGTFNAPVTINTGAANNSLILQALNANGAYTVYDDLNTTAELKFGGYINRFRWQSDTNVLADLASNIFTVNVPLTVSGDLTVHSNDFMTSSVQDFYFSNLEDDGAFVFRLKDAGGTNRNVLFIDYAGSQITSDLTLSQRLIMTDSQAVSLGNVPGSNRFQSDGGRIVALNTGNALSRVRGGDAVEIDEFVTKSQLDTVTGSQNLQQVTDEGAVTTNEITVDTLNISDSGTTAQFRGHQLNLNANKTISNSQVIFNDSNGTTYWLGSGIKTNGALSISSGANATELLRMSGAEAQFFTELLVNVPTGSSNTSRFGGRVRIGSTANSDYGLTVDSHGSGAALFNGDTRVNGGLTLADTFVGLVFDESDQTGANGLWRIEATGDKFQIARNLSTNRDFTNRTFPMSIDSTNKVKLTGSLELSGQGSTIDLASPNDAGWGNFEKGALHASIDDNSNASWLLTANQENPADNWYGIQVLNASAPQMRIFSGSDYIDLTSAGVHFNAERLATETFVTGQGYMTSADLSAYATQAWVNKSHIDGLNVDAATLDGNLASSFARIDQANTFIANQTINAGTLTTAGNAFRFQTTGTLDFGTSFANGRLTWGTGFAQLQSLGSHELRLVSGSGNILLDDNVTINGTISATSFSGNGVGLTTLNASNVTQGTLNNDRLAQGSTPYQAISLSAADLNNLNSTAAAGFYYETSNADATAGANFPENKAGSLVVQQAAGVTQQYYTYNDGSPEVWFRGFYSSSWSNWKKLLHSDNYNSYVNKSYIDGLGIDAATLAGYSLGIEPAANTMVLRDASGYINSTWINLENDTGLFTENSAYFFHSGDAWNIRNQTAYSTYTYLRFQLNNATDVGGVYANSAGEIGFVKTDANGWQLRVDTSDNLHVYGPNLYLDANSASKRVMGASGSWLYLNPDDSFASGTYVPGILRADGGLTVDSGNRGIRNVTGAYGTVQTTGSGVGTWEGYSIDGRVVFMHDGSSGYGIYDDTNDHWGLYAVQNGYTQLRHAGNTKLQTTSSGIQITGDITGVTDLYVNDQIISVGDSNTYMQFHAEDQWRVVTGGAERLEVNNSITTVSNSLRATKSLYTGNGGSGGSGAGIIHFGPGGASYSTGTSAVSGAIEITLPGGFTSRMLRMTIKVYEYSNGESFTLECGGYPYGSSNSWANTFATIIGPDTHREFNVRFANVGGSPTIFIGETSNTWSYPQVFVTDVQVGFSSSTNYNDYNDGWSISFETASYGTVNSTVSASLAASDWNKLANKPGTIWHSGNDGAGSGLDADLLDGIQGSSYARTDIAEVFGNNITVNGSVNSSRFGLLNDCEMTVSDSNPVWNGTTYGGTFTFTGDSSSAASLLYAGGLQLTRDLQVRNIYSENSIYHVGNTGTYLQFHNTDQWRVVTANVERLEISNSEIWFDETVGVNAPRGIHGGYGAVNSTGASGTWGGTIYSIGPAYDGTSAGNSWAPTTLYGAAWVRGTNANAHASIGEGLYIYQNGSLQGGIGTTGLYVTGSIVATGDITAFHSSDSRLKDNVRPIENSLSKLIQLGGYHFEWNELSDHKGTDVGLIAQELQEVLPEVVVTRDNGYLAVRYEKVLPLVIEAAKELKSELEDEKAKRHALEQQMAAMLVRVERLESA